jgi:hypothetical protein
MDGEGTYGSSSSTRSSKQVHTAAHEERYHIETTVAGLVSRHA